MEANFDAAAAFALDIFPKQEGTLEDAAYSGISLPVYAAYCKLHGSPVGDPREMTRGTAAAIYRANWWNPYCPVLPNGLDFLFFNIAILEGLVHAVFSLQRVLKIDQDGHFGVVTMSAVRDAGDLKAVINSICDSREASYLSLVKSDRRLWPAYARCSLFNGKAQAAALKLAGA